MKIQTALLICLLATACSGKPEPPPPAEVDVGIHAVSFRVPEGWEHLDHGKQHRFQRELYQISASDLGPVTSVGYMRELHRAHRLFLDHRAEDAHALVSGLDFAPAFPDARRRDTFFSSWWLALDGGVSTGVLRAEAEVAWERVLEQVGELPDRELAALVEEMFPSIETAAHREISERSLLEINGRPAVRIETWDRLSHDHRQSLLFVLNEGNLFMLRMEIGEYAEMTPAFETLAGSLAFQSVAVTS